MKKVLSFLLMLIGGAVIGFLGAKMLLGDKDPDAPDLMPDHYGFYLLLLLPVMYLLVIGFHELGHVAAGKWQNFSFFGLTVGPFSWRPDEAGRIRFDWNTNLNLAGGVAIMTPKGSESLRQRFSWFAAGGPIASILLALVAWVLSALFSPPAFAFYLLYTVAAFSGLIALATLIPSRMGGFSSDGMRILTFLQNGPTAKADLANLQALAHIRAGAPYEELPTDLFEEVAADEKVPKQQRVSIDYFRYLQLLAQGEVAEAHQRYNKVMEGLDAYPAGSHGGFYLEQAILEAQYLNNVPAAEAALAKAQDGPMTEALSRHLAEAAIAARKEDWKILTEQLPQIEKLIPSGMDQSRTPIIKNWVDSWKDALPTAN